MYKQNKNACGRLRLVNMGWGCQNIYKCYSYENIALLGIIIEYYTLSIFYIGHYIALWFAKDSLGRMAREKKDLEGDVKNLEGEIKATTDDMDELLKFRNKESCDFIIIENRESI